MPVNAAGDKPGLYAQATSTMLDRDFPSPQLEYLLLDARSHEKIAIRWAHPERPIPVGSLLKPFLALAYGRMQSAGSVTQRSSTAQESRFPKVVCHGKSDGCWRAVGHGSLELEQALAVSCNAYFLSLGRELLVVHSSELANVSAAYGLPAPPMQESAPTLIGATPEWGVAPEVLAEAYARLMDETGTVTGDRESLVRIRTGMLMAARPGGTAARVGIHAGGVLAKTGTAPCIPGKQVGSAADVAEDRCRINGDGLVVLAAPVESPRWLLLVRERGTTGAATAEVAGQMLSILEASHASKH